MANAAPRGMLARFRQFHRRMIPAKKKLLHPSANSTRTNDIRDAAL